MDSSAKYLEVRRILMRYVDEVVVAYGLCPWARSSAPAIGVVWGRPELADWIAEAEQLLAAGAHVAMVVAPELAIDRLGLAAVRDGVAARIPTAGVADFHPDAPLDVATPARAVPFARRAPDPLLQLVPLALLDEVRAHDRGEASPIADQARMLVGHAPDRASIAERIAAANRDTFVRAGARIAATLDDIAADRRAAYTRAGISARR